MFKKYSISKIETVFKSYHDFDRFVKRAGKYDQKSQSNILKKIASIPVIQADPDNFIYLRNRSISAYETYGSNQNYDAFPSKELQEKYATFISCPVDVDHKNEEEWHVIGIVLDSTYIPKQLVVTGLNGAAEEIVPFTDETRKKLEKEGKQLRVIGDYIENLLAIDKKRAEKHTPGLPTALLNGEVSDTSMGTAVLRSICSICGNVAEKEEDFCDHIAYGKGKYYMHEGVKKLAVEINEGLSFFEDSVILSDEFAKKAGKSAQAGGEGADFNAKILEVVANKQEKEKTGTILDFVKTAGGNTGYYLNQQQYVEIGEEPPDVESAREKYEKDQQKMYENKRSVRVGKDTISYGFLRQAFIETNKDFNKFKSKFSNLTKADEVRLHIAYNKIATAEDVAGIIQALLKRNGKINGDALNARLEALGYKNDEIKDAIAYLKYFKGIDFNHKIAYMADDIAIPSMVDRYQDSLNDDRKNTPEHYGDPALIGQEPGQLVKDIYATLTALGATEEEKGGKIESEEHKNTYDKIKEDAKDGILETTLEDFGKDIAKDHLDEFGNYYRYLPKFEDKLKKQDKKLDVEEKSKDKQPPEDEMIKYNEDFTENEPWSAGLQASLEKVFGKNYWKEEQLKGQESKNQGAGLEKYDTIVNKTEFDYKKKNGDPKDYADIKHNRNKDWSTDEFGRPKKAGTNWRQLERQQAFLTKLDEKLLNQRQAILNTNLVGKAFLDFLDEEENLKKAIDWYFKNDPQEKGGGDASMFLDSLRNYVFLNEYSPEEQKKYGVKSPLANDDEHSSMVNKDSVGGSNKTYPNPFKSNDKEMLAEYPLSGAIAKTLTLLGIFNKTSSIKYKGYVIEIDDIGDIRQGFGGGSCAIFDINTGEEIASKQIGETKKDALMAAKQYIDSLSKNAHVNPEADKLMDERLKEQENYKFENADKILDDEFIKGNLFEQVKKGMFLMKKIADVTDMTDEDLNIIDEPNYGNETYRGYDREKRKTNQMFTLEELKYLEDNSLFGIDIDLNKAIRGLGSDYEVKLSFNSGNKEGQLVVDKNDLINKYYLDVQDLVKMYSDENNKPIVKVPTIKFWDFPLNANEYFEIPEELEDEDFERTKEIGEPINTRENEDLSEAESGYDEELIEDYVTDMHANGESKAEIYTTIKKKLPQLSPDLIQKVVFKTWDKLEGKPEKQFEESNKEAKLKALADLVNNDFQPGANVKVYKKDQNGNPTSEVVDQGTIADTQPQQGEDNKQFTDVNMNGKNYSTNDFVVMKNEVGRKEKLALLSEIESIVLDCASLSKEATVSKLDGLFAEASKDITPKIALNKLESLFDEDLQVLPLKTAAVTFKDNTDGFEVNAAPLKYARSGLMDLDENFFES